jgi:hypothetical protein
VARPVRHLIAVGTLAVASLAAAVCVIDARGSSPERCRRVNLACKSAAPLPKVRLDATPNSRSIIGVFNCGGQLTARETPTQVVLRYVAPDIAPGAASCASVPLIVRLAAPLGRRTVVDAATHQPLDLLRWNTPLQVCGALGLKATSSASFITNDRARRFVAEHPLAGAPPAITAFPAAASDERAVWCWSPDQASPCSGRRCPGPRQWYLKLANSYGQLVSDVAMQSTRGRRPPQHLPR